MCGSQVLTLEFAQTFEMCWQQCRQYIDKRRRLVYEGLGHEDDTGTVTDHRLQRGDHVDGDEGSAVLVGRSQPPTTAGLCDTGGVNDHVNGLAHAPLPRCRHVELHVAWDDGDVHWPLVVNVEGRRA